MGWATSHIAALQQGRSVQFRPRGSSMAGRIESGQLVTVAPLGDQAPRKDEVVLCKVGARQYLHLVKAVKGARYLIGNNRGGLNGWVGLGQIYGRCIRVEA